MRYWTLEKGDVIGPFESGELQMREGFGAQTLVCPEDCGDNHEYWKTARSYEDFASDSSSPQQAATVEQEAPKPSAPPPPPVQDENIERHFQKIYKGEDSELGAILGIKKATPRTQNQSEDNLEKTASFRLPGQNGDAKPFTSSGKILAAQKAAIEKAKEIFEETPPATTDFPTLPVSSAPPAPKTDIIKTLEDAYSKPQAQFEVLQAEVFGPMPKIKDPRRRDGPKSITPSEAKDFAINLNPITESSMDFGKFTAEHKQQSRQELKEVIDKNKPVADSTEHFEKEEFIKLLKTPITPAAAPAPTLSTQANKRPATEGFSPFTAEVPAANILPEPIKTVTKTPDANQDPAADTLGFEVENTQLSAAPITERIKQQKQKEKKEKRSIAWRAIIMGSVLVCVISFAAFIKYEQVPVTPIHTIAQPAEPATPETTATLPARSQQAASRSAAAAVILPKPPVKETPATAQTDKDKAIALAKQHLLKKKNVAVAAFLDSYFEQYLEQGYTASWSSEPLHKDTYIVKYKLTKTRKEPIVYIFEVDVKKGILTGALNNLTVDLLDM